MSTGDRLKVYDDQILLENTNKLLAHIGMRAKEIVSIDELIRVGSSMFVAIFETIFNIRLEDIIRQPKDAQDYISNCQAIIRKLSQRFETDFPHITGELIYRGDRRALHHLVRLFMRITLMISDDVEHNDDEDDIKSDSISSHESAFPPPAPAVEPKLHRKPITDSIQSSSMKDHRRNGGVSFNNIRLSPPWSPLSAGYNNSFSSIDHTEEIDELDLGNLRHSLSEYEQYRKVDAARKRRDIHLRLKTYQSIHQNQRNLEVTCATLQRQWTEDVSRQKYSAMLRKSDADSILLRKIQKGMLKQLYDSNESYNQEIKSKIKEIRMDTKLHFESLQNLFDSRVQMMKEKAVEIKSSSDQEVSSYKVLTNDLIRAQKIRQQNISNAQQELVQQKRTHSAKMRKDAHQQLLSFISMTDTWEDSLRSDSLSRPSPSYSKVRMREEEEGVGTRRGSGVRRSSRNRKSPYETPIIRSSSSSSRKNYSKIQRSRSANSFSRY